MRLLILTVLLILSTGSFTQTKINEKFTEEPLSAVFETLESKYGLSFAYDPKLIADKSITITLINLEAEEALTAILNNTGLSYNLVNKEFVIVPSRVTWNISSNIQNSNGEKVPFTKVRVVGTYKGTYADENGNVNLSYVNDSEPILEISSIGYKTIRVPASQLENGATVKLELNVKEFETVVVEYLSEGMFINEDISRISIKPKKLVAVPGTTDPDIFQMVQNVPGINSSSETVSEIQIRGGTADQNHLIWEGITLYMPGHFNGMISSINPNIIDRADIYRGVYSPYYGGKIGGLIDLSSINYQPKKLNINVGSNMLYSDANIETPIGEKMGFLVSGRRSLTDLWLSPTYTQYANRVYQETEILSPSEFENEPGFEGSEVNEQEVTNQFLFYDANAKFFWRPTEKSYVSMSGMYAKNSLYYSTILPEDGISEENDIVSSSLGFGAEYKQIWTEKISSNLEFSWSNYEYNFSKFIFEESEDTTDIEESNNKNNLVNHLSLRTGVDYKLNEFNSFIFGYQLESISINYSISDFEEEGELIQETGSNEGMIHSVYANHIFSKNRFFTKVGARLGYYALTSDLLVEPRVHLQYKLNEFMNLNLGFSRQNQYVNQVDEIDQSDLGLSNRIWVMADGDEVEISSSNFFDAGLSMRLDNWSLDVEGYYKDMRNIVNFSSNQNLSTGFVRGDATAYGVDFILHRNSKFLKTWLTYTLSTTEYSFPEIQAESFIAPFVQPHRLKFVNVLSWRSFQVAASFRIASGRPYTGATGYQTILPADPEEEENEYIVNYQNFNNKTLPLFHQLDLTILWNFPKNPDVKWKGQLGFSILNVYNRDNLLNRTFDVDWDEDDFGNEIIEVYAIDRYYLGFTPNALIRFYF